MTRCAGCGHTLRYHLRHDAYYCATCDKWLDLPCTDPNCPLCAERPAKPSELFKSDDPRVTICPPLLADGVKPGPTAKKRGRNEPKL